MGAETDTNYHKPRSEEDLTRRNVEMAALLEAATRPERLVQEIETITEREEQHDAAAAD